METALTVIAWATGATAALAVALGLVLFVWGALAEGGVLKLEGANPAALGGAAQLKLLEFVRKAWKILFSNDAAITKGQKLMAAGAVLVFSGFTLLLIALGSAVGAWATANGGSGGSGTPATTSSTLATTTTS